MTIIPEVGQKMRAMLNKVAQKCAQETKLVQRQGGKVNGTNLSQTLVFGWWQNPDATLEQLCQTGMSVGLSITPQGLDQRFNRQASELLKRVLQEVVAQKVVGEQTNIGLFERFSHVYIQDSSMVTLATELQEIWQGNGGKGTASTVKLETRLELKQGQLDGPHLVNGRVNDNKAGQQHAPVEQNALHLKDLGYWKLDDLQQAHQQGSWWVSRLKAQTKFHVATKVWAAADWCQQQSEDEFEVAIELGKQHKIRARLLGQRVPPEVAQERRRKLKRAAKKQGVTLSAQRLQLCEWTLLVTNAPVDLISYEEAFVLQRIRWQIELLFKLWKSAGKIDKSRSLNPWRQLCELYAKLIAMVLQQWLFAITIWRFPDRSWTKASQTVRAHVIRLATTIQVADAFDSVLADLRHVLSRGCRINKSKKQKRAYASLLAFDNGEA